MHQDMIEKEISALIKNEDFLKNTSLVNPLLAIFYMFRIPETNKKFAFEGALNFVSYAIDRGRMESARVVIENILAMKTTNQEIKIKSLFYASLIYKSLQKHLLAHIYFERIPDTASIVLGTRTLSYDEMKEVFSRSELPAIRTVHPFDLQVLLLHYFDKVSLKTESSRQAFQNIWSAVQKRLAQVFFGEEKGSLKKTLTVFSTFLQKKEFKPTIVDLEDFRPNPLKDKIPKHIFKRALRIIDPLRPNVPVPQQLAKGDIKNTHFGLLDPESFAITPIRRDISMILGPMDFSYGKNLILFIDRKKFSLYEVETANLVFKADLENFSLEYHCFSQSGDILAVTLSHNETKKRYVRILDTVKKEWASDLIPVSDGSHRPTISRDESTLAIYDQNARIFTIIDLKKAKIKSFLYFTGTSTPLTQFFSSDLKFKVNEPSDFALSTNGNFLVVAEYSDPQTSLVRLQVSVINVKDGVVDKELSMEHVSSAVGKLGLQRIMFDEKDESIFAGFTSGRNAPSKVIFWDISQKE